MTVKGKQAPALEFIIASSHFAKLFWSQSTSHRVDMSDKLVELYNTNIIIKNFRLMSVMNMSSIEEHVLLFCVIKHWDNSFGCFC